MLAYLAAFLFTLLALLTGLGYITASASIQNYNSAAGNAITLLKYSSLACFSLKHSLQQEFELVLSTNFGRRESLIKLGDYDWDSLKKEVVNIIESTSSSGDINDYQQFLNTFREECAPQFAEEIESQLIQNGEIDVISAFNNGNCKDLFSELSSSLIDKMKGDPQKYANDLVGILKNFLSTEYFYLTICYNGGEVDKNGYWSVVGKALFNLAQEIASQSVMTFSNFLQNTNSNIIVSLVGNPVLVDAEIVNGKLVISGFATLGVADLREGTRLRMPCNLNIILNFNDFPLPPKGNKGEFANHYNRLIYCADSVKSDQYLEVFESWLNSEGFSTAISIENSVYGISLAKLTPVFSFSGNTYYFVKYSLVNPSFPQLYLPNGNQVSFIETQCNDGIDNDLDGKVDCLDSDCSSTLYCSPQTYFALKWEYSNYYFICQGDLKRKEYSCKSDIGNIVFHFEKGDVRVITSLQHFAFLTFEGKPIALLPSRGSTIIPYNNLLSETNLNERAKKFSEIYLLTLLCEGDVVEKGGKFELVSLDCCKKHFGEAKCEEIEKILKTIP